jgi:hypothetical protein
MKNQLNSLILSKESVDEWAADEITQNAISDLKLKHEFIHLLIGYKRYLVEQQGIEIQKIALTESIAALEDAQKTPEQRIAELKNQLKELG